MGLYEMKTDDITVLIINYQTPDLLSVAVNSFMEFYPDAAIIIFDNGSKDDSVDLIKGFSEKHSNIRPYFSDRNIFHGPAMDFALRHLVNTKYCFVLDSDTKTCNGGFLEEMRDILEEREENYAIGSQGYVNKRGFVSTSGIKIIFSPFMLMKREVYLKFRPFIHHGQPVMFNYNEAVKGGYKILNYPIENYIDHYGRGTASKFGYSLGIKGKIDFIIDKLSRLAGAR